ncbi:MAG: cysteine--tRNA ligase [Bacteroidetes bacterium]|nr:cysteine--tRNA ligase [Bacteroidota bacterium]
MPDQLHIYNSLTRKKELFEPLNPPHVGLYVCGPTVYSDVHLGNVRSFLSFDIVYRYLCHLGYKVRYVRNITDVGHLVDDADEGEDKIAKKARLEALEPMEIVQKYTNGFHKIMRLMNIIDPSIEPQATGHIIDQIEMVKRIIDNGFAYEVNGSVYFDVEKYSQQYHYGELSGRVIEDMQESGRDLDSQDEKRNKIDFAIWKNADASHIMRWPSPWGDGFPGWHLECSVMSTKYLGKTFDIHGGGMDLKFPHHECEIAQSVAADGTAPVKYWMHGGMLNFEGKKMSKSLGNSILPEEMINGDSPLLDKPYSPMTIRFLMLQTHYASEIDFSNKALQDAEKALRRLTNALKTVEKLPFVEGKIDEEKETTIKALCHECSEHMNDDFNTAKTIAALFGLATQINTFKDAGGKVTGISNDTFELLKSTYATFILEVLGLKEESTGDQSVLNDVMSILIDIRNTARAQKDWATSDTIRNRLSEANIIINDNKDGQTTFEIG